MHSFTLLVLGLTISIVTLFFFYFIGRLMTRSSTANWPYRPTGIDCIVAGAVTTAVVVGVMTFCYGVGHIAYIALTP